MFVLAHTDIGEFVVDSLIGLRLGRDFLFIFNLRVNG